MTDALFPAADSMSYGVDILATFVAWGIGLTAVFWVIGYLVWLLIQLIR